MGNNVVQGLENVGEGALGILGTPLTAVEDLVHGKSLSNVGQQFLQSDAKLSGGIIGKNLVYQDGAFVEQGNAKALREKQQQISSFNNTQAAPNFTQTGVRDPNQAIPVGYHQISQTMPSNLMSISDPATKLAISSSRGASRGALNMAHRQLNQQMAPGLSGMPPTMNDNGVGGPMLTGSGTLAPVDSYQHPPASQGGPMAMSSDQNQANKMEQVPYTS